MKHNVKVTTILVLMFFVSQLVGLAIIDRYVTQKTVDADGNVQVVYEDLPLNIERPEVSASIAFIFIFAAVILGTLLALVLIKFQTIRLWKVWFFLSVFLCLIISFKPFIADIISFLLPVLIGKQFFGLKVFEWIALALAGFLAYRKVFQPTIILSNATEIFIYGGLSAIFVPIIDLSSAIILLILISIYDMYAVWKSRHMVKLATFQRDSKVFAGLAIPYKSVDSKPVKASSKKTTKKKARKVAKTVPQGAEVVQTAILGGGDIGFPMFFSGVILKHYSFLETLIIPIAVTIALFLLLTYGKANKFYPAMPFLSFGCFVGYGILLLI